MKASVASVQVTKVNPQGVLRQPDLVSVEEPLEIRLVHGPAGERVKQPVAITMRTPGHDFELAMGFLFTEGIVANATDIVHMRYCTETEMPEAWQNTLMVDLRPGMEVNLSSLERNFYISSSCGVCGKRAIEALKTFAGREALSPKSHQVKRQTLCKLPLVLRQRQAVFEHTGSLHGCAFFTFDGQIHLLREDVGRHNALDKLIGACMANNSVNMSESILILSGRVSFELIQKAAMARVPVVVAVGAPSSLAVQTANDLGMTLVGFLAHDRFNVYSHHQRIELNM
ncbi:MAG: formate dehydrogenase accessory sulfurtransferase FdhD [Bacteroidetes bacterium]|nr:formate dehydrogenase accessory sulfurtransferase FdhD [Bacteroidota bacterium]